MVTRFSIAMLFFAVVLIISCSRKTLSGGNATSETTAGSLPLIDNKATPETKALFRNLYKIAADGQTLFGHQHATEYGHG